MYGHGISKVGEIVDLGSDLDVLKKSGSWFSFEGTKIAQGREAAKQFMLDNPEVASEIEKLIKEKITGKPMSGSSDEADTASD
jgi:recombination protein RecA